ncbi:hypothetical protein B9Z65_5453 [Elsinoe australis]|uniref:Acylphosphatase n=1 Tax=Elsinoe australis TaxID=40998 RepID=A0A2P7ZE49_9PEZI|nr:hypothetical protein B9Z65_5453 [Elsinoe australis]
MSKRVAYKVEGVVQGVNFRSFTVKQASSAGLTGFVKNDSDGSVTGEAQGDDSALNKFVQHLNKGPSAAEVNKVDVKDIPIKNGESGFDQA